MKHLLILISIFLFSSPLFGQSGKPQTIIIPTGSLGEMSEARIKILEKTLESKLDDHFAIVPKELFEEAQEQAFQEMESDECTEDQCILMIKEILQIENAFKMDLISEDGDTQISITWNDQDQKRVEEDYCEGCKTKGLRLMIGGLVKKLVGNRVIEEPIVVVNKKEEGILFREKSYFKFIKGGKKWFKSGDEKTMLKFEGEIENGVPNGQGIETFIDGFKYVGKFKDGEKHGQGTETFIDGFKYVGEFKKGKYSGQGNLTYTNGDKYVGEFKNKLPNGQGTSTYSNGNKYYGKWKDGEKHGQGIYNWSNGDTYKGGFIKGVRHGQGTLTLRNGNKYVGEYKDGKFDGYGTYTWGKGEWEGDIYMGEYKYGNRHGQGTYTFSYGGKYIGEIKDNKFWNGTEYNKDGKIINKIVNGKWTEQ